MTGAVTGCLLGTVAVVSVPTMKRDAQEHGEPVELVDSERIVERGHCQVVWFLRQGDGWVHASDWPGATREAVDAGPGTSWEARIQLTAPRGTWVMRVQSSPGADRRLSPLDYLRRDIRRPASRVARSYFRIGPRGTLVRATPAHRNESSRRRD